MTWIWVALALPILVYVYQNLFTKKKKTPPGPIGIPFVGHFHLLGKLPHRSFHKLSQKYGPIMQLRFGMVPAIVVSTPAMAKQVLKTHDLNFSSRPPQEAGKHMTYDSSSIGFAPYGSYWRDMRKLAILELLSVYKINQFEGMRKTEIGALVQSLRQAGNRREVVDVSGTLLTLIQDMVCLTVYGRKFVNKDIEDKIGFEGVAMEGVQLSGSFNIADFYPFLARFDLQGLSRRMAVLGGVLDGFVEKIIEEHTREKDVKKDAPDFVDTMMTIMESGKAGFKFDRRHVKAVLIDMLIAGMDTSASFLAWAMSELMRHPHVLKKLQKELEAKIGTDRMIEESDTDDIEYLDAVVKEVLRLHPALPMLVPHESIEDCEVDGYFIPKKSRIFVNVFSVGRDPEAWPNPDAFIPERFIGSNIDLKGQNFELLPFGSGRRGCPGMLLGLRIIKIVLAQMVHCFDWELPKGVSPNDIDMSEHFGVIVSKAEHLKAIPTYRLRA